MTSGPSLPWIGWSPKSRSVSILRKRGRRSAHDHPALPIAAQRSKSKGAPRAAIVALTIDVPPIRRPRGNQIERPPSVPERSVLRRSQSNSGRPAVFQLCSPLTVKRGGLVSSSGKSGPASISSTRQCSSSVSRAAITPPLDPAPTTMTSKSSMLPPRMHRGGGHCAFASVFGIVSNDRRRSRATASAARGSPEACGGMAKSKRLLNYWARRGLRWICPPG